MKFTFELNTQPEHGFFNYRKRAMSNRNRRKNLTRNLLITTVFFVFNQSVTAQSQPDFTSSLRGKTIVSVAFQHQNVPDTWNVNYGGITAEFFFDEKLSFSGALCFGKGSDGRAYGHFPIAGLLVTPLAVLFWMIGVDVEAKVPVLKEMEKLLMTENINYNIRVSDNFVVAPHVSILGIDGEFTKDGTGGAFLTNGGGVGLRTFLTENLTLHSDLSVKHLYVLSKGTFRKGQFLSYAATLSLGYVFGCSKNQP